MNESQILATRGIRIYIQPNLPLRRVVLLDDEQHGLIGIIVSDVVIAEGLAKNGFQGLDVAKVPAGVFRDAIFESWKGMATSAIQHPPV